MSVSATQIAVARDGIGYAAGQSARLRPQGWLRTAQLLWFFATRAAFAAFFLLTSTYCLLVYVPFTFFGFIHNPLLGWLPVFVRWHAALYAALLGSVATTLIADLRYRRTRRVVASFLLLNLCACAFLGFWPALEGLTPNQSSYISSLVALLPLILLAGIDLSGLLGASAAGEKLRTGRENESIAKTTLAALIISIAFAAVSEAHAALLARPLPVAIALRGLGASLCFHVVIFTALGLALQFIRLATRRMSRPQLAYFGGVCVLAWLLCAQALRTIVLPAISFEGNAANLFAAAVGGTVVLCAAAACLKFRGSQVGEVSVSSESGKWLWALLLLGLPVSAYGIPVWLGVSDWEFVLQRIAVLGVWTAAVFILGRLHFPLRRKSASVVLIVVVVCATVAFARYTQLALRNPDAQAGLTDALDTYAGADVSFKTAYGILSRSFDNNAYVPFYEFLKKNTNLPASVSVGPSDVHLVANLQPSPGKKPNIFLFVIDSLRQDFVAPYNPAVDYMPEIGHFAQDNVVMQNAFTRYGGTALSEPAIWVGAMQLHKQYIEPFYSMNNLQKMLDVDGYHSYISVDPILRKILQPSSSRRAASPITELDNDTTSWGEMDFVPTLKRLEAELAARKDPDKPIFAYSQPQNIHTLTLERVSTKASRKEAAISELRRMDAAFGEFVRFLQQYGLYENSIIIVTSDHGDSYGEFGRYGHSNFLFPEIVRIPLIVHLPPQMRENLVWNPQQLAFNTDITPSLYYLLGHRPIVNNELFGRPLFTETQEEQAEYLRPSYLIVCSYAPVYASLGNNGKSLFIVDAVNRKNYFLDLAQDPLGTRNYVNARLRDENEILIRREIGRIDDLYGWRP